MSKIDDLVQQARELRQEADAIWEQAKNTCDSSLSRRLKRRSSELHDRAWDLEETVRGLRG